MNRNNIVRKIGGILILESRVRVMSYNWKYKFQSILVKLQKILFKIMQGRSNRHVRDKYKVLDKRQVKCFEGWGNGSVKDMIRANEILFRIYWVIEEEKNVGNSNIHIHLQAIVLYPFFTSAWEFHIMYINYLINI